MRKSPSFNAEAISRVFTHIMPLSLERHNKREAPGDQFSLKKGDQGAGTNWLLHAPTPTPAPTLPNPSLSSLNSRAPIECA